MLGRGAEHHRALARRGVPEQLERALLRRPRVGRPALVALLPGQPLEDQRPSAVGSASSSTSSAAARSSASRAVGVPLDVAAPGRRAQQLDVARAGLLARRRPPGPTAPARARRARRPRRRRARPRPPRRRGRRRRARAAGRRPPSSGGRRRTALWAPGRGVGLERAREREVQLGALAGQQVVGDHLAEQRVAEPVAALGVDRDDLGGDAVAQRLAQDVGGEAGRLREQRVLDAAARWPGCAGRPGWRARAARRAPSAPRAAWAAASRARRVPAASSSSAYSALPSERAHRRSTRSARARCRGCRRAARRARAVNGREVDAARAALRSSSASSGPQRVPAVQLVGPVGQRRSAPARRPATRPGR